MLHSNLRLTLHSNLLLALSPHTASVKVINTEYPLTQAKDVRDTFLTMHSNLDFIVVPCVREMISFKGCVVLHMSKYKTHFQKSWEVF